MAALMVIASEAFTWKEDREMNTRRKFLLEGIKILGGVGVFWGALSMRGHGLWAKTKRIILPKGTKRESLTHRNPAELDTRDLEITPLKDFGTMGPTDITIDIRKWCLEVTADDVTPLCLTYDQILDMPSIERKVLLICPGVFANHGNWKGISIARLLRMAGIGNDITHVEVKGPKTPYEKAVRYPLDDILSDKVFLAYGVNGHTLPRKHGFPLRVVARDYFGYDWVKYVHSVTAIGSLSYRKP